MFLFFILAGIILRMLPHLPNFAPIAAMALFGGTYLNKKYAIGIPLIALFISDIFIGFYNGWIMFSVYGSFLLIGLIGLYLKKRKSVTTVFFASILSSVIFYSITNFAVWAAPYSFYPHTLQGLSQSYIMGLPFFRNTLLGDLFYVGAMFGLYELVLFITSKWALQKDINGFKFTKLSRKRI